jgi:hypothetical protein
MSGKRRPEARECQDDLVRVRLGTAYQDVQGTCCAHMAVHCQCVRTDDEEFGICVDEFGE